jgi:hypothetical protein
MRLNTNSMSKIFLSTLLLLCGSCTYAQRERVWLDLDKYSCKAGDTVYFRAVIFKGSHPWSNSTNLYVHLYTDSGVLVERSVFPIVYSQSAGQMILQGSLPTANYYLIAFTRQQLGYDTTDFFTVPVLVYNPENPARISHRRRIQAPASCANDKIKGISWLTTPYKEYLSSLLEIDTGDRPRHLQLVSPVTKDSGAIATVNLDATHRSTYSLFQVYPERDSEILCLYEDSVLIGKQMIQLRERPADVRLLTDTLDLSPLSYNSWQLDLPGPDLWYATIDVSDADRSVPSPAPITELRESYADNLAVTGTLSDTSYIAFAGKATRQSGKRIKDDFARQVVVAGVRDSSYVFMKSLKLDSAGNFNLDSLFFFGTIGLKFQLNGAEDASGKDIKLRLVSYVPSIDPAHSISNWEDDTTISLSDTTTSKTEQRNYDLSKVKLLKAAVVRARKNPRQDLDDTYTTGPFSEPALFYYDLRNDTSDYDRDIFWYINAQNGRLHYDPVGDTFTDILNHPIHYFVDEQEYPPFALRAFDFDRIAYIKILESDFLSTRESQFMLSSPGTSSPDNKPGLRVPDQKTAINVCIYTRKGKDFRTMRGGMKGMPITGYTKIIPFASDNITLYWHPLETGHSFRIRFNNSETTRRFRVKVEAMNDKGPVIHCEKVLPE